MKSIFLLLFIALAFTITGQTYEIKDLNDLSAQFKLGGTDISLDDTSQQKYEGSPFFNKDFITGEVVINDSIRYQNIPLRYNIYSDKIQFKNNQGRILEFNTASYRYLFTIENHRFINKEYIRYKTKETGILEILAEGKIKLYKKYSVDFLPATKEAGFKAAEPNRFNPLSDKYFITIDDNIPEGVNLSKSLLNQLKEFKPDVEEYAKSQKIKLRSEQDLIRLIEYCNN